MRFFIFFMLVLFVNQASGQSNASVVFEEPIVDESVVGGAHKSCDDAIRAAILDARSGVLKIESSLSMFEQNDFKFNSFYDNYLIANYGIQRVVIGCLRGSNGNCYYKEMNRIITEKFGSLFFQEIDSAAIREYEKFKISDTEGKKRYIDFDYVYSRVDERASYKADTNHLHDRLRAKVDFKKIDFSKYTLKGFHAEVVIDEMGNVVSCKVVSRNFPFEANEVIQKAVKEIGGWRPALLYGLPVKSRTSFDFLF